DQSGRNDAEQEICETLVGLAGGRRQVLGGKVGDVDVQSAAGLDDVDHDQSDHQGDGGQDLEVDQCLDADPADRARVAHRGDSVDDRAEDDRRDHDLDQRDEPVPEWLEPGSDRGPEPAQRGTEEYPDQALDVEVGQQSPDAARERGRDIAHGGGFAAHGELPFYSGAAIGTWSSARAMRRAARRSSTVGEEWEFPGTVRISSTPAGVPRRSVPSAVCRTARWAKVPGVAAAVASATAEVR